MLIIDFSQVDAMWISPNGSLVVIFRSGKEENFGSNNYDVLSKYQEYLKKLNTNNYAK